MNPFWKKARWDVVSKESLELWKQACPPPSVAEKISASSMNQALDEDVDYSADPELFFVWEKVLKIAG